MHSVQPNEILVFENFSAKNKRLSSGSSQHFQSTASEFSKTDHQAKKLSILREPYSNHGSSVSQRL